MHSPGHLRSSVQSTGPALSSPFVFMTSEARSSSGTGQKKLVVDFPLLGSQKISGDLGSGAETFCTTITVSDIAMESAVPQQPTADQPPPSSASTSATKESGDKTAKTPPRRRSIESSKGHPSTKTTPGSARRRRSGSHTPGSRSPSRNKPAQSISKPLAYTQTQGARDLVALHRESCRLFEAFDSPGKSGSCQSSHGAPQTPANLRMQKSFTDPVSNSPPKGRSMSPSKTGPPHNEPTPLALSPLHDEPEQQEDQPPHKPVPATVMDWTLPSTRKREYAKIDRSNRGIRGLWGKVTPRWLHGNGKRTPFFDESKRGKEYEGSVRRFRLDVPDDVDDERDDGKGVVPVVMEAKPSPSATGTPKKSTEKVEGKAKRGLLGLPRRHTKG